MRREVRRGLGRRAGGVGCCGVFAAGPGVVPAVPGKDVEDAYAECDDRRRRDQADKGWDASARASGRRLAVWHGRRGDTCILLTHGGPFVGFMWKLYLL